PQLLPITREQLEYRTILANYAANDVLSMEKLMIAMQERLPTTISSTISPGSENAIQNGASPEMINDSTIVLLLHSPSSTPATKLEPTPKEQVNLHEQPDHPTKRETEHQHDKKQNTNNQHQASHHNTREEANNHQEKEERSVCQYKRDQSEQKRKNYNQNRAQYPTGGFYHYRSNPRDRIRQQEYD
ncbi:unnamed protein product, partial [Adineta ricciae]